MGIQRAIPQAECVGYSEIDKYANSIYRTHFGDHKSYGDITKIDIADLPDFDVLVGGFPCQAFSIAGKRGGFEDTRGTLFFELARILAGKKPGYFCFENVRGILSHNEGATFRTIVTTLDDLGYDLQWQVLNSCFFGVAQDRSRLFIVGNLRGRSRPKVFPFREVGTVSGEAQPLLAYSLTATDYKGPSKQRPNIVPGTLRTHKDGMGFREIKSALAPTIPARAREDGNGQPVIAIKTGFRRLTPLECERLQAFPDGWTQYGKDGELISNTQRHKTIGNAVTVNVIEAIFDRFSKVLVE